MNTQSHLNDPKINPLNYLLTTPGIILIGALILTTRNPSLLWQATFFAEDGWVFFRNALRYGPMAILEPAAPYAGYWDLLPRLVAALATLMPLSVVPTFVASMYFLCFMLTIWRIWQINLDLSPLTKALVALSFLFVPHYSGILHSPAWFHFISTIALAIILIDERKHSRSLLIFDTIYILIASLSSPLSPFVALTAIILQRKKINKLLIFAALCASIQLSIIIKNMLIPIPASNIPSCEYLIPSCISVSIIHSATSGWNPRYALAIGFACISYYFLAKDASIKMAFHPIRALLLSLLTLAWVSLISTIFRAEMNMGYARFSYIPIATLLIYFIILKFKLKKDWAILPILIIIILALMNWPFKQSGNPIFFAQWRHLSEHGWGIIHNSNSLPYPIKVDSDFPSKPRPELLALNYQAIDDNQLTNPLRQFSIRNKFFDEWRKHRPLHLPMHSGGLIESIRVNEKEVHISGQINALDDTPTVLYFFVGSIIPIKTHVYSPQRDATTPQTNHAQKSDRKLWSRFHAELIFNNAQEATLAANNLCIVEDYFSAYALLDGGSTRCYNTKQGSKS